MRLNNIQEIVLLISLILLMGVFWLSLRNSKVPGARNLAFISVVVGLWNLVYLLYIYKYFPVSKIFLISANYLFSSLAAATLLVFALTYSTHGRLINRYTLLLLMIEPLVTQVLFWVKPWRWMFFFEGGIYSPLQISPLSGLWADIHTVYAYNLEIASVLLLTEIFIRKPRTLLWQSGTLLAGSMVPLIFRLRNLVVYIPGELFDYSLIGYSLTITGLALGIYRRSLVETIPITSDTVIEGMEDGVMILDLNNNIIEINPAAEKIVGLSRQNLYGRSVRSVLPDWFDISNATEDGKQMEMRRSIRSEDNWRYLDVRLSNLKTKAGDLFGQLVVWRDITERKMSENARQRARDEMFVLLNAISNAASHSTNQDDFLSDVIYQIIYPFESQSIAIYLLDENKRRGELPALRLAAHFGLLVEGAASMSSFPVEGSFLEKSFTTKQPRVVENANETPGFPEAMLHENFTSLVILPMFTKTGTESTALGAMTLSRRELNPYSQDEIVRLAAIAEQIATVIDNDRKRQLMIALSERERLMRDLHDSVSQKLYGLVTLTEAAQAGLEAGSKVVPSQVLAKIGENARQAVKEMRLFLYEMQPVDLEQDGLVTVLHHRLAAVEGRADIQARLLAGENISLTKDKEVALYYIAQEALNNVLKHAHATSVLVNLKQTRQNVILEIIDNGRGFDIKNVDLGGLGMQNMKVRTSQINGRLKITSQPGSGTKVQVKLSRE